MENHIKIIDYTDAYHDAFRDLNIEWIKQYFTMEASDYKSLDRPREYILNDGGQILMAMLDDEPVGACALIKMDHEKYDFELAKMAVSPNVQGRGIGTVLCRAVIERAQELGANWLYLESNTILESAIRLYRKLGFEEITDYPSPYERCNIQMALDLSS